MALRVLVDTSAWIEALRSIGDPQTRATVHALMTEGAAVLCDMVLLELWNGARSGPEKAFLSALERDLEKVETSPGVWAAATEIARVCRQNGTTAPATDLLIAGCAAHYQIPLLHRDAHLVAIAAAQSDPRLSFLSYPEAPENPPA